MGVLGIPMALWTIAGEVGGPAIITVALAVAVCFGGYYFMTRRT